MRFFLFFWVSFFVMTSCRNSEKNKSQTYDLSTKILKGPQYKNRLTNQLSMVLTIIYFNLDVSMDTQIDFTYDILPDSANLKIIRVTYDEVNMKMDMKGLEKMPASAGRIPPLPDMTKISKMLKGSVVTLLVNDSGTIQDILGTEEIKKRVEAGLDSMKTVAAATSSVRNMAGNYYAKKNMQNTFGMMFANYYNKPLQIGDKWSKKTGTSLNGTDITMDNDFELLSVKDNIAEIKVISKYNAVTATNKNEVNIDVDMKGNQNGIIKMDLGNGHITDSKIDLTVDAQMKVNGIPVPMTMKGNNVISKL
jgi:Family of unknown function (DUF6263)